MLLVCRRCGAMGNTAAELARGRCGRAVDDTVKRQVRRSTMLKKLRKQSNVTNVPKADTEEMLRFIGVLEGIFTAAGLSVA